MQVSPTNATDQNTRQGLKPAPRVRQFLLLAAQLGLVVWLVHQFAIEQRRGFPAVLTLAAAGFGLHYWLPAKWRSPMFLLLSIASLFLVLSWPDAAWVLGLGLGLIVITWLPVSATLQVVLLLLSVGNLAVWRIGSDHAFWPILGAMFMFRLVLYLFDTAADRRREPLAALCYFFLLPNSCFTLFPVIDYATFRRTYYDRQEFAIYQSGLHWIGQGLLHLLLYRWIKYHLLPAPHEIRDLPHLMLFLAANYALYLRVSGQFHLITGLLHLFGYNLPRTHHWYFLATSFADIWRRINIYWKDFMQKAFFFPVFFRLRRLGILPAMLAGTAAAFLATWLLHSYQTFWLLGDFPLARNEAILWLGVGLIVAANATLDLLRLKRPPSPRAARLLHPVLHSWKIAGMFLAVSLFWGRWTHPEIVAFGPLAELLPRLAVADALLGAAAVLVLLAGVGICWGFLGEFLNGLSTVGERPPVAAAVNLALLLGITAFSQPDRYREVAPQLASQVSRLQDESYSLLEAGRFVQGYYENLTEANLSSDPFSGRGMRARLGHPLTFSAMTRPTGDLREIELVPSWRGMMEDAPLSVNRWGMRDREIEQHKPAGTYRVALVGSSIVMGYGVGDDQVFGVLLQQKLSNAQAIAAPRIELLNFGIGRHYAVHRWLLIQQRVFDFQPDAIYYFAHQDELYGPVRHLTPYIHARRPMPSQCLDSVVRSAAIPPGASQPTIEALLTLQSQRIVRCAYRSIVDACHERNILPVWVYLPMPGIADAPTQGRALAALAAEEGFATIEMTDWFQGYSAEQVKFSGQDHHATALGHRVIAQRLFEAICQRREILPALVPVFGKPRAYDAEVRP